MRTPGLKSLRQTARWLRSRFTGGALILGYHRVADVEDDPHMLAVGTRHFAEQLEVLSKLARPITLQELVQGLPDGKLPPRAVVLTFDDGYADVYCRALPLLEQFQVPATVFVASGYLDGHFPWDETKPEPQARALTVDELLRLARSNLIDIGAHSVNHPRLATLPIDRQRREIEQSKATLQELVCRPVAGFSYPHGSASDATREIVRQSGYGYACTSFNDIVREDGDRFHLPRFWPPDWDGDQFGRWLSRWLSPWNVLGTGSI